MDYKALFSQTPPTRLFFKAAIPGSIGMLASALYQVADGIFISRILGDTAFAGFNLAMPLVIINFALADLIGLGSAVPISIKLGSKDEQEANNYFTCASIMVVLAGILSGLKGPDAVSKMVTNMAFGAYNKAFGDKPRTPNDWLSADTDNVDRYMADPLCGADATVGLFRQMLRGLRFNQTPGNIDRMDKNAPILLIAGQDDPVGDMGAGVRRTHDAFKRAGVRDVTLKLYPGLRHEILNEAAMRDTVYGDIGAWLDRVLG